MPEPFSLITTLKAWLVGKAAEVAWTRIVGYFRPDALCVRIESALKADSAVANVCKPPPTLDRQRLTQIRAETLLRTAVTKDQEALADYLLNEQLIDFPVYPEMKPPSFDAVWMCVANTVMEAVCITVARDEELSRRLLLLGQQMSHVEHQQILAELQALRVQSEDKDEAFLQKLDQLERRLPEPSTTIAVSDATLVRSANLLSEENDRLEQQLREQLDQRTEELWDALLEEIHRHNFQAAISKGGELADWLEAQGSQLSNAVRGRAYLLLAHVALIESSEGSELQDDFSKSHELFERARSVFGDDISDENKLRLISFEAKLLSIDGRDKEAIELLGKATDTHSLTTRLLIHIDCNESSTAAELIRDVPIDEKWCDHAAFVLARSGDQDKANEALGWAVEHGNEVLDHRCRVAIARATLMRLSEERSETAFSVLSIDPDVCDELENVVSKLAPIVEVCRVRGKIESGLEADAVGFAYSCWRLLGRLSEARSSAELLRNCQPVHLEYVNAVIRGDVDFDAEVANRIREDHPSNLVAQDMALALDLQAGLSADTILDQIAELAKRAKTTDEREKLTRLIIQASTSTSDKVNQRAAELAVELVGEHHSLARLVEANRHFKSKDLDNFERILDELEGQTDYLIEQFRAQLLIRKGQYSKAAEILAAVGREMAEPELLKEAARLAHDAKPWRLDIVVQALEDALIVLPTDVEAYRMLAFAYVQLHGFANAAECFARLRELEPNELLHALNLAQCLARANRPKEALEIQEELCANPAAPLEAHLTHAVLLSDLGQPQKAIAVLHKVRDQYWDEPAFVGHYMNIAHAANQEKFAHEGFQQMWSLRETGKAPPEVLEPKSLDDLIKFSEEAREQRNFLQDQLLRGKLPWLFVERLLRNVPYWGWRVRTQPMSWIFDDAQNRASYSVYATNSYATIVEDDRRSLQRVVCSERGKPVVADLSALITLHRLGLLEKTIEYFGQVKIPPSYLSEVTQQSGRLQPHQLSRKTNLETIKLALENRRIQLANVTDAGDDIKIVREYGDEDERPAYRIRDVLNALRDGGRLSQQQMEEALKVSHKAEMAAEIDGELQFADHIAVDLLTLQTIAGQNLVDVVCEAFDRVSISENEQERLHEELRGFEFLAETHSWHEDLWQQLNDDDRVDATTLVTHVRDAGEVHEEEEEDDEHHRVVAIDASLLAQQEKLPLLIDDRVCQNMVLLSNRHKPSAAFGTDCFVKAMLEAETISKHDAAAAFLKLIEWRYRFLVVPALILETIAMEFAQHDLRQVARYVHDCMRDPGLFGGPEPTEPPLPIAFRYYQDWLHEVAYFVADIWMNKNVGEQRASELIYWAMTELVPTVPTVLGAQVGRLADFSAFTVLHFAMLRLCNTDDYPTANTALRTIANGLGLDDDDFARVTADVINCYG